MIFNKSSNGAAELKELIGFIYKSANFTNFSSYIGFAERDIRKIISDDVFDVAWKHYHSDNFRVEEDEDHPEYIVLDELVVKIQLPIALHALRRYLPSSDVQHTDKGRQIFVSDNEKPAFEWQTEKDNDNMLALAHEATDVLLEFLDKHIDDRLPVGEGEEAGEILLPWRVTPAYGATKELFVNSVEEFEKVFSIGGSRLTFLSLLPFMRRVQDFEIATCFTDERYDLLKEEILDDDISASDQLIIDRARQAIVLLSLSQAIKRLSVEILPSGIFKNVISGVVKRKDPAGQIDRNAVSACLERDGMRELARLKEMLLKAAAEEAGEIYSGADPTERIDPDLKFVRL